MPTTQQRPAGQPPPPHPPDHPPGSVCPVGRRSRSTMMCWGTGMPLSCATGGRGREGTQSGWPDGQQGAGEGSASTHFVWVDRRDALARNQNGAVLTTACMPHATWPHLQRAVHPPPVQQRVLRLHVVHKVRLAQRSVRLRFLQREAVCRRGGGGGWGGWGGWGGGQGRVGSSSGFQGQQAAKGVKKNTRLCRCPPPSTCPPPPCTHPSASTAGSRTAATPPPACSGWSHLQTQSHQTPLWCKATGEGGC